MELDLHTAVCVTCIVGRAARAPHGALPTAGHPCPAADRPGRPSRR
jgi:hypothetical protein